jgi:uncharacterized membrane protein YheB (UPF0754 family)
MVGQEFKNLILARGHVQASLTRIQTFLQRSDKSQDVFNIKNRMWSLEEMWKKNEEIRDRFESIDYDLSKHDDFRNILKRNFTISMLKCNAI